MLSIQGIVKMKSKKISPSLLALQDKLVLAKEGKNKLVIANLERLINILAKRKGVKL